MLVSSREVAKNFEKNHQHVLRDIDALRKGVQNWTDLFSDGIYTHKQNKQDYREILLNRDGFTLLAMGLSLGPKRWSGNTVSCVIPTLFV